jgi:hypothetical protein
MGCIFKVLDFITVISMPGHLDFPAEVVAHANGFEFTINSSRFGFGNYKMEDPVAQLFHLVLHC